MIKKYVFNIIGKSQIAWFMIVFQIRVFSVKIIICFMPLSNNVYLFLEELQIARFMLAKKFAIYARRDIILNKGSVERRA